MIVFISPTKNMLPRNFTMPMTLPKYAVQGEQLLELLLSYNDEDIMNIMQVNAKLAIANQERFKLIRFDTNGTHALSTYDGLAFKYMSLNAWSEEDIIYANQHLRILSAFYGIVKPLDSIYPYRLEMQARGLSERIDNLYSFWSDDIMQAMREDNEEDSTYINLASKEYSQAIIPYLRDHETCINIHFKIRKNDVYKIQATTAKMARGQMVAWIMKERINKLEHIKQFCVDGWSYKEDLSSENDYVFVK